MCACLCGWQVTEYPELIKTKKELDFLEKLYALYMNVISTIHGYSDIMWHDVVTNIERMAEQVNVYLSHCKQLPKALKEWRAYKELKKTIDDFLDVLPLLQQLSNKAIRPRHWDQISQLTRKTVPNLDQMRLEQLLAMKLLEHRDEIEEICSGSVKELQVTLMPLLL